jgi:hypothetical protein
MLLETNGRASSGRRTRHINIRYFFVSDRIQNKEMRVEYCPTDDTWGDFFTKTLQGSKFKRMRAVITNISEDIPLPTTTTVSQECVGKPSYADVLRGTRGTVMSQSKKAMVPVTVSSDIKLVRGMTRRRNASFVSKSSLLKTNLI